jgi:hypothetical protein
VVALKLNGDRRRASSRFASRCNSQYNVLNSASVTVLSPFAAAVTGEEIIDFMQ